MEESRRHEAVSPAAPAAAGEVRRLVRRWPGLRGEAKLAWEFLWCDLQGSAGGSVVVASSDVGGDQGTSDRAGRRALVALLSEGLIQVIDRGANAWTIYMPDPREVQSARRALLDPQRELFDELEQSQPPAEVVSHPPRSAFPRLQGLKITEPSPSPAAAQQQQDDRAQHDSEGEGAPAPFAPSRGGSDTTSAGGDRLHVSRTAEELLRRLVEWGPGDPSYDRQMATLVARLRRDIDGLDEPSARRVARALLQHEITPRELDGLVDYARRQVRDGTAFAPMWGVFVGAAKRCLSRHSVEW